LKETKEMRFSEISQALSRDQRNIWTVYNRSCSKKIQKIKEKEEHNSNAKQIISLLNQEILISYSETKLRILESISQQIGIPVEISNNKETETKSEISIPLSVFSTQLGALEAISLYLRDKKLLKFNEIAEILQRNERTIWTAHQKAKQKNIEIVEESSEIVPVQILSNNNLTIFESLIKYLKETKEMRFSEISQALSRDQRNIWTVYNRTNQKTNKKQL
jgi:nucleoside-triphosphatase THEP1